MEQSRFNPFKQIHKGLRALLYDTALSIQHTNFANDAEAEAVFEKLGLTLQLFLKHAETEDTKILPAVKAFQPAVASMFEMEHDKDELLAKKIQLDIAAYRDVKTEEERIQCGFQLLLDFNEYIAFNLLHMNREETELNKILWEHYSDEALLQIVKAISANVSPEENEHYMRWMLSGSNDAENITWLKNTRASAPTQACQYLYRLAKEVLDEKRWRQISVALGE